MPDNSNKLLFSSSNIRGGNYLKTSKDKGQANTELAAYIQKQKETNEELKQARRAALNLMEDAILSNEALQKSEEKYRTLFQSMDEGYILCNVILDENEKPVDIRYLEANQAAVRMTGTELVGKTTRQLDPEFEEYWLGTLGAVAKTGIAERHEYFARRPGVWYSFYAFKIGGANDTRVAVVFEDITERKNQEQGKEFLLKLNDAFRPTSGLVEIQEIATRFIMDHFASDRCYYYEIEGEQGIIRRDAAMEGLPSVAGVYPMADNPVLKAVVNAGKPLIVNDVNATDLLDESLRQLCNQLQLISFIDITLSKNDTVVGILCIVQNTPRKWTEFEIQLAKEVAERTCAAVQSAKAEEARRESEERKEFLLKLNDTIRQLSDPGDIQYEAARLLAEELEADRVHFAEMSDDEKLVIRKDYVRVNAPSVAGAFKPEEIAAALRLNRDEPVVIPDTHTFPLLSEEEKAAFAAAKIRSQLSVAFSKMGKKVASFSVDQTTPRQWKPLEISILQEAAERIWSAVERAKAEEALRKSEALLAKELEDTKKLQKISSRMIEKGDVHGLFEALIDSAIELMHSDCASVQILEPQTNQLVLAAWKGLHPQSAEFFKYVHVGSNTTCGTALNRKSRVVVSDVDNWKEVSKEDLNEYRRSGIVAMQSTPLISRSGKCVGMMSTHWKAVYQPSDRELRLFELLARQVADLIERTQAEDALRQSEERFRTLTNSVPQLIWTNDAKGRANFFNERWYQYSGLNYEESVALGWEAIVHPDDVSASTELWQKALATGKIFDAEYRLRRHDGFYSWFIGRNVPLKDQAGKIVGWFGSATDIEQLKKAEESLRLSEELNRVALVSAEMGAWDWNVAHDNLKCNDQYYKLLGISPSPAEELSNVFLHFVHPDDLERVQTEWNTSLETGLFHSEFRIIRADDQQVKWINGYGRPLAKDGTDATRMIGVIYDITVRKKMEQQKDDFIGIASHELKTPLTSIKVYTELLAEIFQEKNDTTSVSYMQKLDNQVDRITGLVSTLLDTAKITEGQLSLNKSQFDMNELIDRQLKELKHLARGHEMVFKAGKLKMVNADKERIAQVVTNFLTNAIKYSPKGGEVLIRSEDTENGIRVSVRDKGMGISEKLQEKIFDRFFRIDSPAVKTFPGMGIGLYIAQNIIQRHKGSIGVESKLGEGSEFYFVIPYDSDSK